MLRRFSAEACITTMPTSVLRASFHCSLSLKIQKAAWQRRQPFVQGRIVLTESKPSKLSGEIL